MSGRQPILICACRHGGPVGPAAVSAVVERLAAAGADFEVVDDLCGLAAGRDERLRAVAAADRPRVAACFPRAVRWLFHAAGADLPNGDKAVLVNLAAQSPESAASLLADVSFSKAKGGKVASSSPSKGECGETNGDWLPWFPVIDYSRCVHCRQCAGFCLFGVYGVTAGGQVEVQRPANCKTFCPACARVCPKAAIIFPKHNVRPFNGDEVRPEDLERKDVAVDVRSLAAADIADLESRLRARQKK